MTGQFNGFPREAWMFLDKLATDNTVAYFNAHRDTYSRAIAEPSKQLVAALADRLPRRVHPNMHAEPRIGGSMFRLNRDTRFSKDKTPYKTHLDFVFWVGGGQPRTSPAAIPRITSNSVLIGAGRIRLRGDELEQHRKVVAELTEGAELRTIIDDLIAGGATLSDANRARVPRPYPPDHPNADLLLRDGCHISCTCGHPNAISTARFPVWFATQLKPFGPLLDWLSRASSASRKASTRT